MTTIEALSSIRQELERAERKFPSFPVDPIHAAAIVQEEAGELVQAALQHTYESGGFAAMYSEAMQVGAMALRFLIHLDSMKRCPSEQIRSAGLQPLTAKAAPL
jgi:NTP pyrophosphatase (non-canonical NTP hydrolase)